MPRFQFRNPLWAASAALLACVLTLGLSYLWALLRVCRHAALSPVASTASGPLMVLGKRLSPQSTGSRPDRDFEARIGRAAVLIRANPTRSVVLCGGGHGGPSEAAAAGIALEAAGLTPTWFLEEESLTTVDNFIKSMPFIKGGPCSVVSSRYHLARCGALSRRVGIDAELIAAEDRLELSLRSACNLLRESAYLCVVDFSRPATC